MKATLILIVPVAVLLFVLPARGGKQLCGVAPNPVSLAADSSFTVTATGAIAGDSYEVTDQQQGHQKTDEDRVWLGTADFNGNIAASVPVVDGRTTLTWRPYGLWPGDVSVKVIHYQQGGSGFNKGAAILASCSFTVTD